MKRMRGAQRFLLAILICGTPCLAQEKPTTAAALAHASGLASYRQGEVSAARTALERAIELDYDFVPARYDLGLLLLEMGENDEGLRHFWLVANEISPEDAEAHHRHALALNQAGRANEAAAALRKTLAVDPKRLAARRDLITLLLANNDLMAASQLADEAIRLHAEDGSAHNDHGVVLMRLGKTAEALKSFNQAVALDDLNPDAHFNLGRALSQQWKLAEAADQLKQALQLAPSYTDARFELAIVYARQRENALARSSLEKVIASEPRAFRAHFELGMLAFRERAFKQAFQHFTNALRQNPGHASSQLQLARVLVALERLQPAVAQYLGVLQQDATHAQVHLELAEVYSGLGDLPQAKVHYQEALWLRPHWELPRRQLAALEGKTQEASAPSKDVVSP